MFDFHVTSPLFYTQLADTNQVLVTIKDIQQFYQDSFTNLLWTMGTIFVLMSVVIGVVMPLILQWLQSRSFNKTEQKILEKFQNDIETSRADLKSEISSVKKELKQDAEKEFIRVTAESLMSHAANLGLTSPNIFEIVLLSLRAAWRFAKLRDTNSLETAIGIASAYNERITNNLNSKPLSERKKCVRLLLDECEVNLNQLKDEKLDTKYFEQILDIRTTVSKIKLNP